MSSDTFASTKLLLANITVYQLEYQPTHRHPEHFLGNLEIWISTASSSIILSTNSRVPPPALSSTYPRVTWLADSGHTCFPASAVSISLPPVHRCSASPRSACGQPRRLPKDPRLTSSTPISVHASGPDSCTRSCTLPSTRRRRLCAIRERCIGT